MFLSRDQLKTGVPINPPSDLDWSEKDNRWRPKCLMLSIYKNTPFNITFVNIILDDYQEPKKENVVMRSPEKLKEEINQYVASADPAKLKEIPTGLKGKMVGEFNRIFGGNENRRIILGWLFTGSFANPVSTTTLTNAQIAALLNWLSPAHEKDGWTQAPTFRAEAALLYAYVAQEHTKTETYKSKSGASKMKISPELAKVLK